MSLLLVELSRTGISVLAELSRTGTPLLAGECFLLMCLSWLIVLSSWRVVDSSRTNMSLRGALSRTDISVLVELSLTGTPLLAGLFLADVSPLAGLSSCGHVSSGRVVSY